MSLFVIAISKVPTLFVHIPKTAGTSIRAKNTLDGHSFYAPKLEWEATYGPLKSFAFIRNPFTRLEAAWRDFRYLRHATSLDFPHLIQQLPGILSGERVGHPDAFAHHVAPMTHPIHGLKHASFIGRYENLDADFARFCESIGVKPYKLPHLRPDTTHIVTWRAAMRKQVTDLFAADFDLFESVP